MMTEKKKRDKRSKKRECSFEHRAAKRRLKKTREQWEHQEQQEAYEEYEV